jgi:hypothetical protein
MFQIGCNYKASHSVCACGGGTLSYVEVNIISITEKYVGPKLSFHGKEYLTFLLAMDWAKKLCSYVKFNSIMFGFSHHLILIITEKHFC